MRHRHAIAIVQYAIGWCAIYNFWLLPCRLPHSPQIRLCIVVVLYTVKLKQESIIIYKMFNKNLKWRVIAIAFIWMIGGALDVTTWNRRKNKWKTSKLIDQKLIFWMLLTRYLPIYSCQPMQFIPALLKGHFRESLTSLQPFIRSMITVRKVMRING